MGKEHRRERRIPFSLPLRIAQKGSSLELLTENVSFRGAFLRTDSPPHLRQLIQIEGKLPPRETGFSAHGMVVHVVELDNPEGRTPGCGIQFYALSGPAKDRWQQFVRYAIKHNEEQDASESFDIDTGTIDVSEEPIKRRHSRVETVLDVHITSLEELYELETQDVSRGGLFIKTDLDLDIGTKIQVRLFHPESDATFDLPCIVVRATLWPEIGLGVEFEQLGSEQLTAFQEFVASDLETADMEELEFVEEDDPGLA